MSSAVGVYDPGFADHNDDGFNIVWVFVAVIAVLVGLLLATRWARHAVDAHHAEQPLINSCYNNGGTMRNYVYKERYGNTLYLPCEFQPGKFGVVLRDMTNGENFDSYQTGDGSMRALMEFLRKKGTRWTKTLPADVP